MIKLMNECNKMQIKWTVWGAWFKLIIKWMRWKLSRWSSCLVESMISWRWWWWLWWWMMLKKCFLRKALRWRDAYDLICCRQLANNRRSTKLLPIKSATHCMSAWTIIVKLFLPKNLWYWWILLTVIKMVSMLRRSSYFFFWAFSAAFVT